MQGDELPGDAIVLAGGVLGDPQFLLEKVEDDGGLSMWVATDNDGDRSAQILAAAKALPIPNGKVRVTSVEKLRTAGWWLVWSPDPEATDPDRHYDATTESPSLQDVERLIACFAEPIVNPCRH